MKKIHLEDNKRRGKKEKYEVQKKKKKEANEKEIK